MSTSTSRGCGTRHPHIDVTCNHHAGDGRHRFVDEWGTLDSWPAFTVTPGAAGEQAVSPPQATASQMLTFVVSGTLLSGALAVIAFMLAATLGAIS